MKDHSNKGIPTGANMNITFTVTINYTHKDVNGVICPDSMRDNLYDELYQACLERWRHPHTIPQRQLTPENIEVTALEVSLSQQEQTGLNYKLYIE